MKKILWIFIVIPLSVVLVTLSVANRHEVSFVLDPFSPQNPALSIHLPFYIYMFAAVMIGFILGSLISWFNNGKWRQAARTKSREAQRWQQTAEKLGADCPAGVAPAKVGILGKS
ncbi:MAG: LapA family protein [Pseudomonadota bacterium]